MLPLGGYGMETSRVDTALANHKAKGFDCCESVFLAYNDLLNVPYRQARDIAHCHGCNTGIYGFFDTYEDIHFFRYMELGVQYWMGEALMLCGALCGAFLCACVKAYPIAGELPSGTIGVCETALEMDRRFKDHFSTGQCSEIKNQLNHSAMSCASCDHTIRFCSQMVEEMVFPSQFKPFEIRA